MPTYAADHLPSRFATLELDGDAVQHGPGAPIRGYTSLPIRFTS